MGFWNWLQGKLLGGKSVEVSADTITQYMDQEKMYRLVMEEFTIHAAINLIANCISKSEFKTFQNGKETQGEEYYAWNYEPNANQNSSQFLQELVTKLLYNNECLVVESAGQLIVAEGFCKDEYALKETIFSNVYRKGLTFQRTFKMSEVLYFQLNNKNIRRMLSNLCGGYQQILSEAVDKYEKAGGEKGTLHIDAVATGTKYGNKSFEEVYEELMNVRFRKFFNSRSAVLPLFSGFTYTKQAAEQSKKSTSEIKDITDVLDEIVETVARAFNIPVSLLKGDVSDVEKITRNFLTFCIDPFCEMIQTEINRKRYGKNQVWQGNFLKIDTTTIMHTDVFDIAEKIDKLIASGMYCIDELRKKLGDEELNTEESKKHWITKNYTEVTGTQAEEDKPPVCLGESIKSEEVKTVKENVNKYYALEVGDQEADIMIFGDIASWPWMESDVSAYRLSKQISGLDVDTINVHINSYGGEVAEGLAIYNSLKQHKANVRTYCDGFACSIASVIFMAGDERVMSNASLLMVHNPWTYTAGNAQELRKMAADLDKMAQASVNAYMEHVSISEDEVKKLLDEETWLEPSEALDYGFASSVSASGAQARYSQSVRRSVIEKPLSEPKEPGGANGQRNPEGVPTIAPAQKKERGNQKVIRMMEAFVNAFKEDENEE